MLVLDARRVQQSAHRRPVSRAFIAQVIGDLRGAGLERLILGDLGVEEPQGIALEPQLGVGVETRLQRPVVLGQTAEVCRPALAVADRVQLQAQVLHANLIQPAEGQLDHLGVESGACATHDLDVELKELAVPSLLWLVVSKHGSDQIKTRGLWTLVEPALEVRAYNTGGRLWPERELLRATLVEAVQLFGHRVRVFADPLDQLELLDDRRCDLLIAKSPGHVRGALLCLPPKRNRGRQDVANSAGGFDRLSARHWSDQV